MSDDYLKVADMEVLGGASGNDVYAATANASQVVRAMFAEHGIWPGSIVECSVRVDWSNRNGPNPNLPVWDIKASVVYDSRIETSRSRVA